MKLMSHFPRQFQPRQNQIDLINKIESAYKTYDTVICSAPTGTGKSFLSKTLANSSSKLDSAYEEDVNSYDVYSSSYDRDFPTHGASVLTITKALQDQYIGLFDDAVSLKGKSNYMCEIDPSLDVEIAPCVYLPKLKKDCWNKHICPYYEQRNKAVSSRFSVYNYNMFLALPRHLRHKEFLICDEASEIEDEIVKHFQLKFTKKMFKYLDIEADIPNITNYIKFQNWLQTIYVDITDKIAEYIKKPASKNEKAVAKFKLLSRLGEKIERVIDSWKDCEFILDKVDDTVSATPLYVSSLTRDIFEYGDKKLLMSATIIDPEKFAKNLGIDNFEYIEAASTFESKKAPIFISKDIKLNHANLKSNLPKIVDVIKGICEQYGDVKGAIHTHTNFITSYLKNYLTNERFIFRHEEVNNEQLLEEHISGLPNSVIISPSITHGVDLKDDLARFQIIIKLPYLPLQDKRIKKLFEDSKSWYANKMLSGLVQACGRGIRNQEDWCDTYILDGNASSAILRSKAKLPKYFLDRIH